MGFGQKSKNLKDMRRKLKERGNRSGIQFIGEDGIEVRFLEEPEEWTRYREAYSPSMRKAWPMPDTDEPQMHDARVSVRYLVNVLDIKNDRVVALKLPITLVDLLSARAEKRGTITDIDIELYKSGEGMDTVYGFDPMDKTKRNLDKYELLDVEKILQTEYDRVWGDDDSDDDDDDEPVVARPSKRRTKFEPVDEDDDDDLDDEDEDDEDLDLDDEDEEEDDDDLDDDDEDEPEDDEDTYWTREELEELTLAELRAVAKEHGVDTKGMKKASIVDTILDA